MKTRIQTLAAAINLYAEYFLGLIVSVTVARSLPTEDYGLYSSIIWIASLIILLINAGLSINVTKFVAEFNHRKDKALGNVIHFFWKVQLWRVLLCIAVVCPAIYLDLISDNLSHSLLFVLLLAAIVKADYMYRVAIFKGIKRFDIIAKTSLIANPFNMIAVLFCAFLNPTLESFIIVYCLSCFIYGVSTRLYASSLPTREKYHKGALAEHKQRLISQIIASTAIVLLGAILFKQSQVVLLEKQGFLSEAGYFNIAFLLATAAITLVPGVYQEVLLPKITEATQTGELKNEVNQAEIFLFTLSILVMVPILFYADVIIFTLYGEQYAGAILPLQVMVVLKTLLTLLQGPNLTLISNDKQVGMAKTHFVLMAILAALSYVFIPTQGIFGALFVYGILVVTILLFYFRMAKEVGYSPMPLSFALRVLLAAFISAVPVYFVKVTIINGILSAIVGSLLFILCYLNLLILFRGYHKSVTFLLKGISTRSPRLIKPYIEWSVRRLS
jgi:O-antigen/teichoic acid export membrane protein